MNFSPSEIQLFQQASVGIVFAPISIHQPGRVWCSGTYWPAKLYADEYSMTLLPSENVMVIGRQGITLLVVPQKWEMPKKDRSKH